MADMDVWAASGEAAKDDQLPIVGLDFGTSNSCVSVWDAESSRAVVIRNRDGNKITPSNVTYQGSSFESEVAVGLSDADVCSHTVAGIKGHLSEGLASLLPGRATSLMEDPRLVNDNDSDSPAVASLYEGVPARDGAKGVRCVCATGGHRVMHPEEVAAEILRYLRVCAEEHINSRRREQRLGPVSVRRAVIGVPATCSERQRTATRVAARLAGFTEVHFMVESTAAALSYGLLVAGHKAVLVFDMGGGTLDVTIMAVRSGTCQVLATAGHPKCGGFSIDRLLAEYVVAKIDARADISFEKKYRLHQQTDHGGPLRARLRALCRAAKELLSDPEGSAVRIDLPSEFFYEDKVTPTEHSGGALPVDDISTSEPAVAAITEASEKNRSRHGLIGASSSSSSGDSAEEKELEAMFRAARGGEQGRESRAARDSSSDASSDGGQNFHNFPSALTSIPREVGDDEGGTDGVWRWTVERAATAGEGGLDMVPMCGDASTGDKEAAVPPVSRRKIKVTDNVVEEYHGDEPREGHLLSVEITSDELKKVVEPVLAQVRATVSTAMRRWRGRCIDQPNIDGDTSNEGDYGQDRMIDEIVLVGGSSRVLCVREALRETIGVEPEGRLFMPQVTPGGAVEAGRDLCTSLDPERAVAQGLAVRGAILMGVDRSLLKDVLMLDTLSTAIGLRAFETAMPLGEGGATSAREEEEGMFETILVRGSRLPAANSKVFRLANASQKLVTVEVFEQLETPQAGELVWQRMGVFTCVVPKSCIGQTDDTKTLGGLVDITFRMSESGYLSVSVSAASAGDTNALTPNSGAPSAATEGVDEESDNAIKFLVGVIVVLTVFYLVTKLFILEKPLFDTTMGIDGEVAEGVGGEDRLDL